MDIYNNKKKLVTYLYWRLVYKLCLFKIDLKKSI